MKYILVIGDGMADDPLPELGGKTPLEVCDKPCFDSLARRGLLGLVQTIPEGFPPGSDTAIMSIFGCDPAKYFSGRAPLELAASGGTMPEGGACYRCNMVALGGDEHLPFAEKVMLSHSAGSIEGEESDELVGRKTAFALAQGLSVMLCIGETLAEREGGQLRAVLQRQLQAGLAEIAPADVARLAVAYEPVWAIGTGKVAGPEEASEAHAIARELLLEIIGAAGESTPLLYGGSVKPGNAAGLLALDNVDGLLVGGASLDADSFAQIIFA